MKYHIQANVLIVNLQESKLFIFLIPIFVFIVDQLSKHWVKSNFEQYVPVNIIGHYLRFTYCENPGMAFGIKLGGYVHILTVLSILFTFYIIYYLYQLINEHLLLKLSMSLILGGALGNVYDRVMMILNPENVNGVIDFIDVGLNPSMRWYIFNIADSAITIGIILYLIHSFISEKEISQLKS
jgi:signal peptidase II